MEKIFEDRFEYKGFGIHDSWCFIEVYIHNQKCLVIMTEPNSDTPSGTSVTNACEDIATDIYNELHLFEDIYPENIIWVEHYCPEGSRKLDTYDRIDLHYDGGKFTYPIWEHLTEGTFSDEDKLNLLEN